MLNRWTTVLLVAACFALLLWRWSPGAVAEQPAKSDSSQESTPATAKATPSEWNGRVIYVMTGEFGVGLEKPQIRKLGDRYLVAGRAIDEGIPSTCRGRLTWVPLDKVTNIVEFESTNDLLKAAEEGRSAATAAAGAGADLPFSN